MTFRGILLLFVILVLVPIFMGKVSLGQFGELLKSPTNATVEQWRNAGKDLLGNVAEFYMQWAKNMFRRFRPKAEEKFREYNVDDALRQNRQFIDESLELVK